VIRRLRVLHLAMAGLFGFAALLQLNDPDPIPWVAIYLAACIVSLMVALDRRMPRVVIVGVGLVAIAWAANIALGGPRAAEYGHMFDAWEMKSPAIEEAREASGLVIVTIWMAVLFLRSRRFPVQP
jgi:hypothetical protein